MKQHFIKFLFLFICGALYAQEDTIVILNHYEEGTGAMIKWLPTSSSTFIKGCKSGYNLYRADVYKAGGGEQLGQFTKLNTNTIKIWEVERLKEEIKNDSLLELATLFVGGRDELINRPDPENTKEAVERTKADDFLHLLGAFSTLSNNHVAEAMGLFFLDETALTGKKYMYKLELVDDDLTGYLLVNDFENQKAEKILGLRHELVPDAVYLSWFNNDNKNYPYYNIYRSNKKNGKYQKLNVIPYVGQQGSAVINKSTTAYIDSFPAFNRVYYYKIIGVNGFGFEGTPSDVLEVEALYLLKDAPRIIHSEKIEDNDISLKWEMSEEDKPYVQGYNVFRANNGEGPYHKVNEKRLPQKQFKFVDETSKGSSNYYYISAYGAAGDSISSILHSLFLLDSIPPEQPIISSGVCDTNGIVTLQWELNKATDLEGYRIFKTYDLKTEPVRLLEGHLMDTIIIDTVDLKQPYNKIYYRIFALDQHFNPSIPSAYFEVPLPDKNPPINGNLTKYSVGMNGISLQWQPSTSYDLKKMYLLRKGDENIDYKQILELTGDSLALKSYTDTTTKSFMTYHYVLQAEDEAGLKSKYSKGYVIKQLDKRKIPAVQNLNVIVNKENRTVKLTWDFGSNAVGFRIYRKRNDGLLQTHKYIDGKLREYYDKELKPNSTYTYLIIGELAGGYKSGYSKKVKVKY